MYTYFRKRVLEPFDCVSESRAREEFSNFMYKLFEKVPDGKTLLLIFDELDYLERIQIDGWIFEFLSGFIDNNYQWARCIFAGSRNIFDLVQQSTLASLLAKGCRISVDCFIEGTSRDVVTALTSHYFKLTPDALDKIIALVNGHPDLLKEVLRILVRYWEDHDNQPVMHREDIEDALEDIRSELHPHLHEIWVKLSLSERQVMHQIAKSQKADFQIRDIFAEQKRHTLRDLKRLVDRQILTCKPSEAHYSVRLGLLTDLIMNGILS